VKVNGQNVEGARAGGTNQNLSTEGRKSDLAYFSGTKEGGLPNEGSHNCGAAHGRQQKENIHILRGSSMGHREPGMARTSRIEGEEGRHVGRMVKLPGGVAQ